MAVRYDRTLRIVMWWDAFLSVTMVAVCLVALPVVAVIEVPGGLVTLVGIAAIVSGVLLAACGALTGVALLLRMSDGDYGLPTGLRLPLPRVMRPRIGPP